MRPKSTVLSVSPLPIPGRRDCEGFGGEFTLWINGQEVTRFVDDEAPIHSGGRQGYLVITSPLEEFPPKPVIVRFRE